MAVAWFVVALVVFSQLKHIAHRSCELPCVQPCEALCGYGLGHSGVTSVYFTTVSAWLWQGFLQFQIEFQDGLACLDDTAVSVFAVCTCVCVRVCPCPLLLAPVNLP